MPEISYFNLWLKVQALDCCCFELHLATCFIHIDLLSLHSILGSSEWLIVVFSKLQAWYMNLAFTSWKSKLQHYLSCADAIYQCHYYFLLYWHQERSSTQLLSHHALNRRNHHYHHPHYFLFWSIDWVITFLTTWSTFVSCSRHPFVFEKSFFERCVSIEFSPCKYDAWVESLLVFSH